MAALKGHSEKGTHKGRPYNVSPKPGSAVRRLTDLGSAAWPGPPVGARHGVPLPCQLAHRVSGRFERERYENRFLVRVHSDKEGVAQLMNPDVLATAIHLD